MLLATFLVYLLLFIFLFSRPRGNKSMPRNSLLLVLPLILAAVMVIFTVIRAYFIYKLFMILMTVVLGLLTYWHWAPQFRRWFRS